MNHPFCEGTLSCSFNKLLLNPPTLNKNIWIKSSFYAASKFISTPLLPWHLENIADSLTMTNINYCLFFETQIFIPLDHRAVYFPKSFPKLCYKRLFMYEVKYGNTGLFLSLTRAHAHKLMWSNGYWQHSRVVIRVAVLKSYYFWITVLPISSLLLTWVQLNLLHWLSVHSTLGGLCGMD